MPNLLEKYLSAVGHQMRSLSPLIREGEVRETESHLRQLIDDLMAQGHDEDAATAEAIKRFGPASRVGIRLRDVWEGNRGWLAVLSAFMVSNILIFIGIMLAFFFLGMIPIIYLRNGPVQQVIQPITVTIILLTNWGLPPLGNYILGRWAGRRALPAAILSNSLIFLLSVSIFWGSLGIGPWKLPVYLQWLIVLATAVMAAAFGANQVRRQRFSLVEGSFLFDEAALTLRQFRAFRWRWSLFCKRLALIVLILGSLGLYLRAKINAVLHPSTPEEAVRILLSAPGGNYNEIEPATEISTRVLPPSAPLEKSGKMRRVAYIATMHASDDYRKRRIAFLQRQLKSAAKGKPVHPLKYVRQALNRLRPQGYVLHGVARVVKAPDGWHWDTSGSENNQPWAWLYDIYYEDQMQYLREHPELQEPK